MSGIGETAAIKARARRLVLSQTQREAIAGWLFALPWALGFLLFVFGPMVASIVFSLLKWDLMTPAKFVGLRNYQKLLTNDPLVWQSLKVTTIYAFTSVPLTITFALFLAVLLNQKIKLLSLFRSLYYLPSVIGGIAVAVMWRTIFGTRFGLINGFLRIFDITGPSWLGSGDWVIVSFVIMSLWGAGGSMLIYLGGLQGIPTSLYEAAEVDGAGAWSKFVRITVPMMTPVIFFNAIMGIISALQIFVGPFIMTGGGPHNSSLFVVLYLYQNAFQFFKMGYASALAWVLFLYIMIYSILVVRSSDAWVYYEGTLKGR